MIRFLCLCTALVLASHPAAAQTSTTHEPTSSNDPVLTGKAQWSAMSHTAEGITGDITTSPVSIRLAGHTIALHFVHSLTGEQLGNAAKLLSVSPDPGATAALYHVSIPPGMRLRNGNTFCGRQATTWLMLMRSSGGLGLAAFSGAEEPDLTPAVIGNSTTLCGTYGYTAVGR